MNYRKTADNPNKPVIQPFIVPPFIARSPFPATPLDAEVVAAAVSKGSETPSPLLLPLVTNPGEEDAPPPTPLLPTVLVTLPVVLPPSSPPVVK